MEILAPSGNIKSLIAAVNSGANAVYLGIDRFNARLKADNFTTQNLAEWVEYCHLRDVKVYLALNTNIKEKELDSLRDIVKVASDSNVDALIVADMAVVKLAKEIAPTMPLHASTQLGVYNLYGAKCAKELGFSRVVLSREATVNEIIDIKTHCDIEVEYFVHGALCVSFSGGCLMSSIANGNSGNRGGCLQLCRKEYGNTLSEGKGYFLSPKDQCLIDELDVLSKAGVDSLKIEGRMKSPEYVSTTVKSYSKAIKQNSLTNEDYYKLKAVFNRGNFTKGYSFTDDIIYSKIQGHYGVNVGNVISCKFNGKEYLVIAKLQRNLADGCGVKFIHEGNELGGCELRIKSKSNNNFTFSSPYSLPINTSVHVTNDRDITCQDETRLPIELSYIAQLQNPFSIKATYKELSANFTHTYIVNNAEKMPSTKEIINTQLSKLGNTEFELSNIFGSVDNDIFIPNSVLNESRRQVVDLLKQKIIKSYNQSNQKADTTFSSLSNVFTREVKGDIIEVSCAECDFNSEDTYIVNYSKNNVTILKNKLIENNLYIKLPKFLYNKDFYEALDDISYLPSSIGIYADNISHIQIARETKRPLILGFGMNIMNDYAVEVYNCKNFCLSPELNREELRRLNGYVYSYGFLPVMTLNHCPYKVVSGNNCKACSYNDFEYTDNYGKYKLRRTKLNKCYFNLYNSLPHNLLNILDKKYIDLSIFDQLEVDEYLKNNNLPTLGKTTQGHYKRGVN